VLALASDVCVGCALIIPLIIQTILLDLSGAVRTDETSNVSRPDRSGADQIDVEHQATDLAVGGSNPSRRAPSAQVRSYVRAFLVRIGVRSRRIWSDPVRSGG
jgi:hypothetical protein